jgi:hypothetical protein
MIDVAVVVFVSAVLSIWDALRVSTHELSDMT